MAKLTDLVLRSSEVTGIPAATVREIARRLREDGLIRTGKGGRYGGAEMAPSDAASLLTALLIVRASSISFNQIVRLTQSHLTDFRSYSSRNGALLFGRWHRRLRLPQLYRLGKGHTFGDAFSALIASIADGDLERATTEWAADRPKGASPYFAVSVDIYSPRPHREARIRFESPAFDVFELHYVRPPEANGLIFKAAPRRWSDLNDGRFDLTVTASIRQETLKSIGVLLRNVEVYDG
jgi:hypothetical protein